MSSSKAITSSASSQSWLQTASTAARSERRTSSPSSCNDAHSWSSSSWKVMRRGLAEPPSDIVLGPAVAGLREDRRRPVVLDQDAVAAAAVRAHFHAEERGHVGDARSLLHVV